MTGANDRLVTAAASSDDWGNDQPGNGGQPGDDWGNGGGQPGNGGASPVTVAAR